MALFRDWPRTLQRASFRGVPFFVESDQVETGRRLVVHEFPLSDTPYIEDLGRDANKISVRAYLVSDSADAQSRALRAACERGGPGRLALPMDSFLAHCESCSRDFSKDKLGYVAFSLKFVREGTGAIPFPAGFLAAQVTSLAAAVSGGIASALTAAVSVIGQASFVAEAAAAQVRGVAATLDTLARRSPIDPVRGADLLLGIASLYDDAGDLVAIGDMPGRLAARRSIAGSIVVTAAPLVDRVAALLESYRLAVTPETAMAEIEPLLVYATDTAGPLQTPSRRRIAANAAAIDGAVRQLALATWASASASRIYKDRREAIQARADAGERFAAEMAMVSPATGHAVYAALANLQAALVEYLSRRIADMAPVLTVEAPVRMPSLWWSNRLYGTHARAGELVQRNRVIHGSFMPERFEALAK